ncbi:DUF4817 domain-containing protein [Nephila pilipes]|uniref:DUF4817 domain-containing protein n=1 Tax=Nephila pilipes TaxID=299642 RepID=A0A8X6NYL0_NEPPI|nr:DUF4817 domain-containing protein [Nephila pilipes]
MRYFQQNGVLQRFEKPSFVDMPTASNSAKISRYTIPRHIFIVKTFYERNKSPVSVARAFSKELKVSSGPGWKTITRFIVKFEHTGSVCDNMSHNVGRKSKCTIHWVMQQWANELEYANDVVGRKDNTTIGGMKVWFSDEAHFHLDRYVNKQN